MSAELKAFYEYHSSLMEPWDGPASIAFTDGSRHRRGPRPQRPASVALLRDEGRPRDHGVRGRRARHPAREHPDQGAAAPGPHLPDRHGPGPHRLRRGDQARSGARAAVRRSGSRATWSTSRICRRRPTCRRRATRPCCAGSRPSATPTRICACCSRRWPAKGEEAVGSMGTDASLAVLSDHPRLLYDYFTQVFAQVTNPPLDAIREQLVTAMGSTIGPEGNLLDPRPESCHQIAIKYPVIDNDQLAKVRHLYYPGFRSITLPMVFDPRGDGPGLERAMEQPEGSRQRGGGGRLQHPDPVGSRHRPRSGADSEPARDGGRAPSSRPRRHPHALRAGRRIGRCARSASLRAAARLRRRRGQPVPGVRDARRHDPSGHPDRRHARAGGHQLHQGAQQGHPQGDVEDGDLDAAELLRRADLRSGRPRSSVRRQVLHLDRVAHRRRRHRGHRDGSGRAASPRVPEPGRRR